jgi:arylsulfatase A
VFLRSERTESRIQTEDLNVVDHLHRIIALVPWLLAVAVAILSLRVGHAAEKPNILLIVSDDQGYADGGCFGGKLVKTPHLDRLAKQGVRLTNYYVTWPACTPSRGSILTGRYPQHNGLYDMIRNNEVDYGYQFDEAAYAVSPEMTLGLDVREITMAQVLKNAGYTTGVVGKWDSGRARRFLPLQRGFDFYYGFANTGIDYWTHERYGIPSLFRGNERIKRGMPRTCSSARPPDSSAKTRINRGSCTCRSTRRTRPPISRRRACKPRCSI